MIDEILTPDNGVIIPITVNDSTNSDLSVYVYS